MKVHQFASTTDAYDWSNVGEHPDTGLKIDDGDVLVVASEGVIGFLHQAWPVAVIYEDPGSFHTASAEAMESEILGGKSYEASFKLARDTAQADADITGNPHWAEAL